MKARWGIWCSGDEDGPHWFGAWLRSEEPIWAEPVFYRTRKDARTFRDEAAPLNTGLKLTVKRAYWSIDIAPLEASLAQKAAECEQLKSEADEVVYEDGEFFKKIAKNGFLAGG